MSSLETAMKKLTRNQLRNLILREVRMLNELDVAAAMQTAQETGGQKSPDERIKDLESYSARAWKHHEQRIKDLESNMEFVMDKVIKLWDLQGQQ